MKTYKEICEYYSSFGVVRDSEVQALNNIQDQQKFNAKFREVYQTWKMRKRVQENRQLQSITKTDVQEEREMRGFLIKSRAAIVASLKGKPIGQQRAIRNNMQPFYSCYGLGEFYDEIYKSVKDETERN